MQDRNNYFSKCTWHQIMWTDRRTLYINQHDIFAACIQETWRSGVEVLQHGNCCIIGAGLERENDCKRGSQGVGIILSKAATDSWRAAGSEKYIYGGHIIAVWLLVRDTQGRDLYLFLISAYAPVGNADQLIWDQYLTNLQTCIAEKRVADVLIIGTDTNSSMGCSTDNICLGNYGIPYVNDSGRRFA